MSFVVAAAALLSLAQTVRIQLGSEMTLHLSPVAGGAACHVRLSDSRGAPIAYAPLSIRVDDNGTSESHANGRPQTDAEGRYTATCVQGTARQRVAARFAGNARARGVEAKVVYDPTHTGGPIVFDAAPRRVAWRDAEPLRVIASPGASIEFRAAGPAGLPGWLDAVTVVASRAGEAILPVELWRVVPGMIRIEALRREQDGTASAITSRFIAITSATRIRAKAERRGATVAVTGKIDGPHGVVARASLVAFVSGAPRHAFTSDPHGDFAATFIAPCTDDASPLSVTVHFQPDRAGLEAAQITLETDEATAHAGRVIAMSVAAAALLFLVVWCAGRLRSLRPRNQRPSTPGGDPSRAESPVAGITFSPSRSFFSARSSVLGGVIVDAVSGAPIPSARVTILLKSTVRAERNRHDEPDPVPVDETGRFKFDASGATHAHVSVDAPNYIGTAVDIPLPHRGAYSTMCISLLSIREAVRDLYVAGAKRLGFSRAHVLQASPREIVATVSSPNFEPIDAYAAAFDALFFGGGPRTDTDRNRFAAAVAQLPDLAPTERDRLAPLHPVGPQQEE